MKRCVRQLLTELRSESVVARLQPCDGSRVAVPLNHVIEQAGERCLIPFWKELFPCRSEPVSKGRCPNSSMLSLKVNQALLLQFSQVVPDGVQRGPYPMGKLLGSKDFRTLQLLQNCPANAPVPEG